VQASDAVSSDRCVDDAGQICTSCLPGCGDIAAELRDECLNQEILSSLKEAQVVIGPWRNHYNAIRWHSSLNYRPPASQAFVPLALHRLALHLDEIIPM
jgi:putative transposase